MNRRRNLLLFFAGTLLVVVVVAKQLDEGAAYLFPATRPPVTDQATRSDRTIELATIPGLPALGSSLARRPETGLGPAWRQLPTWTAMASETF